MADIQTTIEQTFRAEHGRVLAALISQLGDFALAEDALQDALVAALEQWAAQGVPRNPGAWLTTIAKRRAIDRVRRDATFVRKQGVLLAQWEADHTSSEDDEMSTIPDERLKLMFTCCHPSLALDTQVALTLRTLGGLSTEEVARAFLVPVPTMAQRLVRARTKIQQAGIPYRVPPLEVLPERLDALLAVLYLIFNEGYSATSGDTLVRRELCQEAIRLGRVVVELLPPTPLSAEARGLLALMLLHDARREARVNAAGELVILEEQNRQLWHSDQIQMGITLLQGALALRNVGVYQIQAAISAVHAEAPTYAATDWQQIVALYRLLRQMNPSAVVELNYAVAVSFAQTPTEGLHLLQAISGMDAYYPYHLARADMLRRLQEREAALEAYEQALELCQNQLERMHIQRKIGELS